MNNIGIEKYCKYCENASALSDGDVMLCERFGIVKASHKCRRFRYDPIKRIPKRLTQEPTLEFVNIDEAPALGDAPDNQESSAEKHEEKE